MNNKRCMFNQSCVCVILFGMQKYKNHSKKSTLTLSCTSNAYICVVFSTRRRRVFENWVKVLFKYNFNFCLTVLLTAQNSNRTLNSSSSKEDAIIIHVSLRNTHTHEKNERKNNGWCVKRFFSVLDANMRCDNCLNAIFEIIFNMHALLIRHTYTHNVHELNLLINNKKCKKLWYMIFFNCLVKHQQQKQQQTKHNCTFFVYNPILHCYEPSFFVLERRKCSFESN